MYFVTSNDNKLREAVKILNCSLDMLDLDIQEIQSLSVEEIVEDKARRAYERVGKTVLVEDTGLYVKAWNGFPGGLIKWVMKTLGNEGLCRLVKDFERTTVVKACVGLCDGRNVRVFTGEVTGIIVDEPRGQSGFGWDPLFQPDGWSMTYAEMTAEQKNGISHRKKALIKMKEFLENLKKT